MRCRRTLRIMKYLAALISVILFLAPTPSQPQDRNTAAVILNVHFSPNGGCTEAIIKELDKAENSVLVQAYSFTSAPIAKALLNAHKRGVKVEVILDKSQRSQKYSSADFLANSGILTRIDAAHAIAHNKVMIIDSEIIITGSFNFSRAADEKNAENLLIIRDKALGEKYIENWREHAGHSEVYKGKGRQD
jgi:phosphatidylserine/phosphatidylglycerophosphate/cardiolipin synthase-like enzyme